MKKEIAKGMILAAGLGTRLRPLTDKIPKPLIRIGDRGVIEYNLALLERSWIGDVIINLHHLGDQVKSHLGDGSGYGLRISYSYEKEILGTGGGIKKAEGFFAGEPFVVVNGDIITDVNLVGAMAHHLESGAAVTLVLRPRGNSRSYTPILEEDGLIKEFGNGEMMYTGIQIIDPSILKLIPQGVFSNIVEDTYIPFIRRGGRISAYIHDGFWLEIGTTESLRKAEEIFRKDAVDLWYL